MKRIVFIFHAYVCFISICLDEIWRVELFKLLFFLLFLYNDFLKIMFSIL